MRKRFVAMLVCALVALLLLPATAFAQDFTPNARLDDNGVLHWDAEGEYYGRIDLSLLFGPNSADHCVPSVDGEYTYDIENLFQAAEQFYGRQIGDIEGLGKLGPTTPSRSCTTRSRQTAPCRRSAGRRMPTATPTRPGNSCSSLRPLTSPGTGDDGFTASWDAVANAAEYRVTFYETTADGSTSEVRSTTIADTSCELTSARLPRRKTALPTPSTFAPGGPRKASRVWRERAPARRARRARLGRLRWSSTVCPSVVLT